MEPVDRIIIPEDRAALGAAIQAARERGHSIGSPGADSRWDLSALNRVLGFSPADMILTVEAGITVDAVRELAGQENLWLPWDGWAAEDTLASALAADRSLSWLSHRYGTAKGWVTGMTVCDDRGREVRFGAQVVKNVSGYQLAPLYIGALDALGPLVTVTFRLLPGPQPIRRVQWESETAEPLIAFWRSSGQAWEAFRLDRSEGLWRLDGIARSSGAALQSWGLPAEGEGVTVREEGQFPREAGLPMPEAGFQVCLQVHPGQVVELLSRLEPFEVDLVCYPGAGVVTIAGTDKLGDRSVFEAFLREVTTKGGWVVPIGGAPADLQLPPARMGAEAAIMGRIKGALDPDGVFGPLPNFWETEWH